MHARQFNEGDQMNQHSSSTDPQLAFLKRVLRFQDNALSELEMEAFEKDLLSDPINRRLFMEMQDRTLALRNHFLSPENADPSMHRSQWTWRSLISQRVWAAAAGLVIGLLSASLVSGASFPLRNKPIFETRLALLDQASPPPLGIPKTPGIWSGDYTQVVPAQDGITPTSGSRMLQIQRADHEGKIDSEHSRVGNVWHLVDLRPYRNQSASGSLEIRASFSFNSTAHSAPEAHDCSVCINAVTAEFVSNGSLQDASKLYHRSLAAAIGRSPKIDANPRTWQKVSTELRLPPDADFALVSFNLAAPEPKDRKEIVQFQGKYMDDLQISLGRR